MRLVVGLGNPGPQYAATKHNVGCLIVEALGASVQAAWQRRFSARFAFVQVEGTSVALLLPQTFMNRSGEAAKACVDALAVELSELLVIHDELDLAPGTLRLAFDRGAGGHRGVESITQRLGSSAYWRLRCGIGRPAPGDDPADYVLTKFPRDLQERVDELRVNAVEAVGLWVSAGPAAVQQKFHK